MVKDKSSINKVLELGYKARLISPLDLKLDLKDCLKDPNLNMQILSATEIFLKVPANTKIASVLAEIYPEAKWRVCKTMQVLEPSVQALV